MGEKSNCSVPSMRKIMVMTDKEVPSEHVSLYCKTDCREGVSKESKRKLGISQFQNKCLTYFVQIC